MKKTTSTKVIALALGCALAAAMPALAGCTSGTQSASSASSSSASSSAVSSTSSASTSAVAEDEVDLTGVWNMAAVQIDGQVYTVAEYEEANGLPEGTLESSYTLADDGTMVANALGVDVPGTWEQDGTDVTLIVVDEEGNEKPTDADYVADSEWGEAIIANDPTTGNLSVFVRE